MNESDKKKDVQRYILTIGFFGGLFAAILSYLAHFLNFIHFGPGIILQTWPGYVETAWMRGPWGHLIGIILISMISILGALIYYFLFRKMESPWVGIWYGFTLWAVLFLGINQLVPGMASVREMGWNTNITLVCIFILYGVFVGYSISYEYEQEQINQQKKSFS